MRTTDRRTFTALAAASFLPAPEAASPVEALKAFLLVSPASRPPVGTQPFAGLPLTKAQAASARAMLAADLLDQSRAAAAGEMPDKGEATIRADGQAMRCSFRVFGKAPPAGHSLWISLHGGGGAPAKVNDSQWENQKRLYTLEEGVYCSPRSPYDTWDLWHKGAIDALLERLILVSRLAYGIDLDRVYLMGYSAGGDGVYQVAPRLADRFAAAAMMAGHPNETRPDGLRNLPFALQVGELDTAYSRSAIAKSWGETLDKLHKDDPGGYRHLVKIHEGKGHWMDRQDRLALPWMAPLKRDAAPDRVVWRQDDVVHQALYWLAVPAGQARAGQEISVSRKGNSFTVEKAVGVEAVIIRLDDRVANLDMSVKVGRGGKTLFEGKAVRTIATIAKTLEERDDPALAFDAEVKVALG
ncbi:MAG: alpha/beta hydrolase [Planctomycetota bacterium]